MKIEDILKLTSAGFTKDEIVGLMKAEGTEKPKQEESKQEESKQEQKADDKVLSAIDKLNENITALFINTSSVQSDGTGTVEDFLANIINPRNEEGGK